MSLFSFVNVKYPIVSSSGVEAVAVRFYVISITMLVCLLLDAVRTRYVIIDR